MSVDTVNTIVDITTLAQVQNELTMLADPIPGVQCTGGDKGDMATACTGDNNTCSGVCTTPTITAPATLLADANAKALAEAALKAAYALMVTAKTA